MKLISRSGPLFVLLLLAAGSAFAQATSSTDLGVNYSLPVGRARLFVETDAVNLLNEQGIEDPDFVNKTVLTRRQTSCLQTGTTNRCLAFQPGCR